MMKITKLAEPYKERVYAFYEGQMLKDIQRIAGFKPEHRTRYRNSLHIEYEAAISAADFMTLLTAAHADETRPLVFEIVNAIQSQIDLDERSYVSTELKIYAKGLKPEVPLYLSVNFFLGRNGNPEIDHYHFWGAEETILQLGPLLHGEDL